MGGAASRAERAKLRWTKARQQHGLGLSGAEPRRAGLAETALANLITAPKINFAASVVANL